MGFRENFDNMLLNSRGGIGKWVVIRHFDRTKRSVYWNDEGKESVGGSPYEYTDTVVLAAKQTAFQTARPRPNVGVAIIEPSEVLFETYRYFIRSGVTIEEDDEILDLDHVGRVAPTVDYTGSGVGVKILSRNKVKFVAKYIEGNSGDLGYKLAITERTATA